MADIKIIQLDPERWKEYKDLRLEMLLKDPQAFGQSYEKSVKDTDSKWKDRLEAAARHNKIIMLFAESNGKLIGTIGAYFNSSGETKNIARVFSVYVNENFRGQAVAKRLQKKLLEEIKKIKGLRKIMVMVNMTQKPAFDLYKSGGFLLIKTEKMLLGDGKDYQVGTMEQNLD